MWVCGKYADPGKQKLLWGSEHDRGGSSHMLPCSRVAWCAWCHAQEFICDCHLRLSPLVCDVGFPCSPVYKISPADSGRGRGDLSLLLGASAPPGPLGGGAPPFSFLGAPASSAWVPPTAATVSAPLAPWASTLPARAPQRQQAALVGLPRGSGAEAQALADVPQRDSNVLGQAQVFDAGADRPALPALPSIPLQVLLGRPLLWPHPAQGPGRG